eukprot:scaffold387075_cov35-Attheya_sp.AAC.1
MEGDNHEDTILHGFPAKLSSTTTTNDVARASTTMAVSPHPPTSGSRVEATTAPCANTAQMVRARVVTPEFDPRHGTNNNS